MLSSKWSSVCGLSAKTNDFTYPHKKQSSGVKSQDLGGQFTGPKREIKRSPNVSCNKSIVARAVGHVAAVLLEPQLLDIMIVQFRNENPEEMAKGVMKLLEDRINGSTLLVSKSLGSRYIGFQEEFKNIPLE
ncbi:hypothetical protein TNCV_3330802 [Trichonephila clavipes]|nr:hypothetical protein TNCV_3330802 [Trichonephila clavipes]